MLCGKQVCEKCWRHLFDIWYWEQLPGNKPDGNPSSRCYVCSEKCYNDFLGEIKEVVDKADVVRISRDKVWWKNFHYYNNSGHGTELDLDYVWVPEDIVSLAYVSWFKKHGTNEWVAVLQGQEEPIRANIKFVFRLTDGHGNSIVNRQVPADAYYSHVLYHEVAKLFSSKFASAPSGRMPTEQEKEEEEKKETARLDGERALLDREREKESEQKLLSSIQYCESVGRYEDAARDCEELAQICEKWGSYDRARELRDRARRLLGKGPQVVVDLNKLIQQVRDGGIVAVYRCPHCGGKLKIDKDASVESLKVCEHCGSEIEVMELADFIRTALS